MTKTGDKVKKVVHSLYVRLILIILLGILAAVGFYIVVRFFGNSYIDNYYTTEQSRKERELNYIRDLQQYVTASGIDSEDTDDIAHWAQNNRYVYLLIYKNNELFFSSDMIPKPDENEGEDGSLTDNGDAPGSGITVQFPTREELKKYAEENDLYELEMADGVLLASVAEFTEYFYYDFVNILSLVLAMLLLVLILVIYFWRIISRVKKLDRNVMAVANGDINLPVTGSGYDEIARLTANVESMRSSIIKGIEDEREARRANTELITAMSHDIRTPLTVLLGYLEIMKNEAEDEKMKSYAAVSEATAMRLKNLSDDMFNYFLAFGSTKESFNIEEYDAATLFEQMLSEPMILLSEQGYKLEHDLDFHTMPAGASVFTDAPKMMRIVDNIFSNLRKYADADYPIVLKAFADAQRITLEIKNRKKADTGSAESNGIGLKTCARLAGFIAESFEYSENDGIFMVRLTVKIQVPAIKERL